MTTRILFREDKKSGEWCEVSIRLEEHLPEDEGDNRFRFSLTGMQGYILPRAAAKKQALEYWQSYFEDNEEELKDFAYKFGKRTPLSAARHVLKVDGELHGLDIYKEEKNKVYITTACGQIREEIAEWFPEVMPYFEWHLNHLHSACIHQEVRGESYSTHPSVVCSDCGWKLGHAWNYRPLPPAVIAWARGE